jgi:hypothetical protein
MEKKHIMRNFVIFLFKNHCGVSIKHGEMNRLCGAQREMGNTGKILIEKCEGKIPFRIEYQGIFGRIISQWMFEKQGVGGGI